MATFDKANCTSNHVAKADLTAESNLYLAVKFDGDREISIATDDVSIGFLQNLPKLGAPAEVARSNGGSKAVCSGVTILAGERLKSINGGKLTNVFAPGDLAIAVAEENVSTDDEVFAVRVINTIAFNSDNP